MKQQRPYFEALPDPSEPDPAVSDGIRRALDQLGIKPADHELSAVYDDGRVVRYERGDQWDRNTELHTPTPSFKAGQDRDRDAALLIAAFSLLIVAVIVSAVGLAEHWATLTYWLNH